MEIEERVGVVVFGVLALALAAICLYALTSVPWFVMIGLVPLAVMAAVASVFAGWYLHEY